MYDEITYETLLERMLERAGSIDGNVDTREGSLVWLGSAPVAMELQNLYLALDNLFAETFADTASREYLIRRAGERGIVPYSATPAVLRLEVVPTSLSLSMNTRFSIGALNYAVTDDLGSGAYELTCETAGQEGNQYSGPVVPIDFIEGLESCSVTALLVPGEDEEDTEALRQRYFDSLNAQAFGGNRIDYIEKTKALPGVGGVKVYRAWNGDVAPASLAPPEEAAVWMQGLSGVPETVKTWLEAVYAAGSAGKLTVGGTVKLVLIDSTFSQPSATLISQVQTAIDPEQNAGEGLGLGRREGLCDRRCQRLFPGAGQKLGRPRGGAGLPDQPGGEPSAGHRRHFRHCRDEAQWRRYKLRPGARPHPCAGRDHGQHHHHQRIGEG